MIYPLKEWVGVKRGYRFGQKTNYTINHLGVDHIVPEGTSLYAPIDCEIIQSLVGEQGGNTIWVSLEDSKYGTLIMRCMHLKNLFSKGKYSEGAIIGYTGNTGKYTTGPHLHTDISKKEVRIKEFSNFIDPEKYFDEKINNTIDQNNMIIYKKIGEPMLYVLLGNILIPFDTDYEVYKKEFEGAQIVELSIEDFSKYKVSETVKIKSNLV